MPLYFFDTRDGDIFIEDDVGLELRDLQEAKLQASTSLTELARDVLPGSDRRALAVEVRDITRPLMEARMVFEAILLAP